MTKKAMFVAVVGVLLAIAAPVFAQGPFADVPVDHWAYEAVSQLQDHGIVIGYPDGTYSGKRAMTRYEFALALSKAIPYIKSTLSTSTAGLDDAAIKKIVDDAIKSGNFATQSDIDNLNKLIKEFKDDLAAMGVDIDALKKAVAGLEERVAAIEKELQRVRITSKLSFFGIGETTSKGTVIGKDRRSFASDNNILQNTSFVTDADFIFDLKGPDTKGKVVVNYGNYISDYLSGRLTTHAGGVRSNAATDGLTLVLAYADFAALGADVTVGRFPIQFTKWTLKKYDIDEYTENWKTDDGNYYVDGAKAAWNWSSVGITAYAGKNNSNNPLNTLSGAGVIGSGAATQSAGVRATTTLGGIKLGANWLSVSQGNGGVGINRADIYGADAEFKVKLGPEWTWNAAFTKSDSLGSGGAAGTKNRNAAWEAAGKAAFGKLDFNAGYKEIQNNFRTPGDWLKIGIVQNPVNLKGPDVGLKYNAARWSAMASAAWYEQYTGASLKTNWIKGGFEFKTDPKGTLGLTGEWVQYDPGAGQKPVNTMWTVKYGRAITENTKISLLYQILDFNDKGTGTANPLASNSFRGSLGAAQVSLGF